MTLARLRVLVEGLDRRGHNAPIKSVALTLLARNVQDDWMAPQAETDVEVEIAMFGLLYCSMYLCAALDVDFKDLVARAHDCFEISKDQTMQFNPPTPMRLAAGASGQEGLLASRLNNLIDQPAERPRLPGDPSD